MFKDVGNLVGRYFQVLAALSIAWMIFSFAFLDALYLDLTFLLFLWAGHHLRRHSPTARRWILWTSGFGIVIFVLVFAYALIAGTQGMKVNFGAERIENPSIAQVGAVCALLVTLVGIPFALLLTRRAKLEFSETPSPQTL